MKQHNILCATDNNFIPYCGIMLTSLFEKNKDIKFNVFILSEGLNKKNITDIATLADIYQQNIEIVIVKEELLKNCPIRKGDHVSIATYYRIIAPELLPSRIDRVLYLDCDIIINNCITELYNTNLDDKAFGAIIDEDHLNTEKYSRLNIAFNKGYINAGVLLMNLKYWREHHLVDKCLAYIRDNQEKLKQHDQDVLNAVLYDKIKLLPLRYNFQTGFIYKNVVLEDQIINEVQECMYTPIVVHYTGPNKPWYKICDHPYRRRFLQYKSVSLWKDTPLIGKQSVRDIIKNAINVVIWQLGIKKKPQTFIIEKQALVDASKYHKAR